MPEECGNVVGDVTEANALAPHIPRGHFERLDGTVHEEQLCLLGHELLDRIDENTRMRIKRDSYHVAVPNVQSSGTVHHSSDGSEHFESVLLTHVSSIVIADE